MAKKDNTAKIVVKDVKLRFKQEAPERGLEWEWNDVLDDMHSALASAFLKVEVLPDPQFKLSLEKG